MQVYYIGDVGVQLEVDTGFDLSAATVLRIYYLVPGTSTMSYWTATVQGDPEDGVLKYTTVADDLDTNGVWILQGYYEAPGIKRYSQPESIRVMNPGERVSY